MVSWKPWLFIFQENFDLVQPREPIHEIHPFVIESIVNRDFGMSKGISSSGQTWYKSWKSIQTRIYSFGGMIITNHSGFFFRRSQHLLISRPPYPFWYFSCNRETIKLPGRKNRLQEVQLTYNVSKRTGSIRPPKIVGAIAQYLTNRY